jgi:hypothetical protein
VPGSRLRVWDGRVTSEARTPIHRFMPPGPGTSCSWMGLRVLLGALRTCRCEDGRHPNYERRGWTIQMC